MDMRILYSFCIYCETVEKKLSAEICDSRCTRVNAITCFGYKLLFVATFSVVKTIEEVARWNENFRKIKK